MRMVEMEIVQYNTEDMVHASTNLIHNYAHYSGIEGTRLWPKVIVDLADIIQNKLPDEYHWQTLGLTMWFSGMPPILQRMHEGKLKFLAKEPHFTLEQGYDRSVRPELRTRIGRVTDEIVAEMKEVFKLEPSKDDSLVYLTFPKSEYAKSIEVFTVPIIEAV